MKSSLALFTFCLLSAVAMGQGFERFPSGNRTVSSNYPEIKGYKTGEPDSVFRKALDKYIFSSLEDLYYEELIQVNGVAEFILEIEGSTVTKVEFIETNSNLFARYLIPILYALEVRSVAREKVILHHRIVQPLPCCNRGEEVKQDSTLNSIFLVPLLSSGYTTEAPLRWKVYLVDGEIQCLIPSEVMEARWTDIITDNLGFISSTPQLSALEDGAYIVDLRFSSVPAYLQVKAFQNALKYTYNSNLSESLNILSHWMEYSENKGLELPLTADTVVRVSASLFPMGYSDGEKWLVVLNHAGEAVFSAIDRNGSLRMTKMPTGIICEHLLLEYIPEHREVLYKALEADMLGPFIVELVPIE